MCDVSMLYNTIAHRNMGVCVHCIWTHTHLCPRLRMLYIRHLCPYVLYHATGHVLPGKGLTYILPGFITLSLSLFVYTHGESGVVCCVRQSRDGHTH